MDYNGSRQARRQGVRACADALARANAKLLREMGSLHAQVDQHQRRQLAAYGKTTCTKGCTHARMGCCRQIVLVTREDAEWLIVNEPEAVARALPEIQRQADALAAEVPAHLWEGLGRSEAVYKKLADAYWYMRMPCAFLVDDACTVYKHRPMPCRTHFVQSDPALCDSETLTMVDIVSVGGMRDAGALGVLQVAGTYRGQVELGPLPLMLVRVLGRGTNNVRTVPLTSG